MKLQQLICFREVAETKNFTQAAGNLFLTQPSVSYNIRELENELGVPLFVRSFSNSSIVSVTEYGSALLGPAEETIRLSRECANEVERMRLSGSREMTVACGTSMVYGAIPEMMECVRHPAPGKEAVDLRLDVCYSADEIERSLLDGKAELAFYPDPLGDNFNCKPLFREELLIMLPSGHPMAKRDRVSLRELGDLQLLLPPVGNMQMLKYIEALIEFEGVQPSISDRGGLPLPDRILYVALGFCYSITVKFPLNNRDVSLVHIDSPNNMRDMYAIWRSGRELSETALSMLEFCRQYYKEA